MPQIHVQKINQGQIYQPHDHQDDLCQAFSFHTEPHLSKLYTSAAAAHAEDSQTTPQGSKRKIWDGLYLRRACRRTSRNNVLIESADLLSRHLRAFVVCSSGRRSKSTLTGFQRQNARWQPASRRQDNKPIGWGSGATNLSIGR